jgi:hypothetical protein
MINSNATARNNLLERLIILVLLLGIGIITIGLYNSVLLTQTVNNVQPETSPNSLDDYPANPDEWVPPEGWVETSAGQKTGGRHRQWNGPNGEWRRWDAEGRAAGKKRGPHWHDSRFPNEHIEPNSEGD